MIPLREITACSTPLKIQCVCQGPDDQVLTLSIGMSAQIVHRDIKSSNWYAAHPLYLHTCHCSGLTPCCCRHRIRILQVQCGPASLVIHGLCQDCKESWVVQDSLSLGGCVVCWPGMEPQSWQMSGWPRSCGMTTCRPCMGSLAPLLGQRLR